jgi:hypothetical protein
MSGSSKEVKHSLKSSLLKNVAHEAFSAKECWPHKLSEWTRRTWKDLEKPALNRRAWIDVIVDLFLQRTKM